GDVRDRARELTGHIGHEDLPARRLRADACRCVHRLARELAPLPRDLAGVQPDTNAQGSTDAVEVERVERTLDVDRAGQGAAGRHEDSEETVAECGPLVVALVVLDLSPDDLVALSEERVGLHVTERRP